MNSKTLAASAILIGAAFGGTAAQAQRGNYGAVAAPQPVPTTAQPAQNESAIKTHAPKVSRAAAKEIGALQKAIEGKDKAAIAAALAAAEAAAKTNDDKYAVGILHLKAAAQANDSAGIGAAIEQILASGSVAAEEKLPLYLHLAQVYSDSNQPARAAQTFQQALQLSPNSIEATAGLAEAKAAQGQTAEAVALLKKGIALQSAGGAKAPEAWYKRAVAIAYEAKLPHAADLARNWLTAYPSADSWKNALAIYQLGARLDESQTLDLMRLKRAAGVLTAGDYFNYGDIAVRKGFAGEAKSELEQGFAANAIKKSDPSFSQLYALASKKTEGDLESLPASPPADADFQKTFNIGDAYYGYGKYDKAVEFYRAALAKPGADKNIANLHLGMALARQGDKAGAIAALKAVGGTEAALAQYWLIYASKA